MKLTKLEFLEFTKKATKPFVVDFAPDHSPMDYLRYVAYPVNTDNSIVWECFKNPLYSVHAKDTVWHFDNVELLDWFEDEVVAKGCACPLVNLMQGGCTCGNVTPYRARW